MRHEKSIDKGLGPHCLTRSFRFEASLYPLIGCVDFHGSLKQNFRQEARVVNEAEKSQESKEQEVVGQEAGDSSSEESGSEAPEHKAGESSEPDPVGDAMGCVASGLFVVTAGNGEEAAGYLASFIQQVSFEPLMLMVAMHADRPVYELVRSTGEFVVHILGRSDSSLVRMFWKGMGRDELLALPHKLTEGGAPILDGVMAHVRCSVADEWRGGDHVVVFAKAEDGEVGQKDKPYFYRRTSGRTY